MSAEQDDSVSPADDRSRPITATDPCHPTTQCGGSRTDSTHHPAVRSARVERIRPSARIAVLERALETSERRRQSIVDQYERLLAERTETTDPDPCKSSSQSRSVLTWLFDR
ncbi:hypothetical protein [Natrinema sp. HArc-T2]|uniref:hypothetical protein n=1 Tax=Natrinema sp. HArc-T2 TaxID=3242701 RepID=UPI00359D8E65